LFPAGQQIVNIEILNFTAHIFGSVADGDTTGCLADNVASMHMPMDHQIHIMAVNHLCKFRVAEQKELDVGFVAESRHGWGDVRNHDPNIGIESSESRIQALGFAATTNGQGLCRTTGQCVRAFVRPESTARTLYTGEPHRRLTAYDECRTVQKRHSSIAKDVPPTDSSRKATVMVSRNRDYRNLNATKQGCRSLGLMDQSVVRNVTGNDQHIGPLVKRVELLAKASTDGTPNVQIAVSGYTHDSNPVKRQSNSDARTLDIIGIW
jgi:hypothetical protein